ncbi:IseA DL-endopeptidase inhibitor family protein [Peribacillus sp. SCS-37]|uniref:IseA DL-endopeptidase inhibitor family protein n=1 Tax=Paraperibacillus esterisolvens TaxID=3115296 RepID=UPI003906966D
MKKLLTIFFSTILFIACGAAASAQGAPGNLTDGKALKQALDARVHYWNVMSGHNPKVKNSKCPKGSFTFKGTDYRYLCSEFDTQKELYGYLGEVFTNNAIDKGMKKYRFITYKGKIAQPNADGGSLLQWEKAKGKVIYKRQGVKLYEFAVPVPYSKTPEKVKVTYVYVMGSWKINAMDAVK